ncbi:hypothetical protein ABW20_dc0108208 [Dactylellina cionopaga]|nr:hypothetical protein ABW20_dc0108208 [Dactylellina cionopaga]
MLTPLLRRANPVLRHSPLYAAISANCNVNLLHRQSTRLLSTLKENDKIYIHPIVNTSTYLLSYLQTTPPNPSLALGSTPVIPPAPSTFTPNNGLFREILMATLQEHAAHDPDLINEAFAGWGATMGVKKSVEREMRRDWKLHNHNTSSSTSESTGSSGDSTTPGGFWNIVDRRSPYYGGMRVPEIQDIFGSIHVKADGALVDGTFVECDSYRVLTRDGMMKLSEYLEEKLVERLRGEEEKTKGA